MYIRYLYSFGIRGFWLYPLLRLGCANRIYLRALRHPLYVRPKTSDKTTFEQIFLEKAYVFEPDIHPQTIIDAGGNIGLAAVYFANRYPEAKIVSLEPERANYRLLKKNTEPYPNIVPLYKALSAAHETLQVVDEGFGHWGFMTVRNATDSEDSKLKNTVEALTVADIMRQHGMKYVDLLKIDIEGYEKELFRSDYDEWLPKVRCLVIELHDGMVPGCSTSFFRAICRYDFSFSMQHENLIFINNRLTALPAAAA